MEERTRHWMAVLLPPDARESEVSAAQRRVESLKGFATFYGHRNVLQNEVTVVEVLERGLGLDDLLAHERNDDLAPGTAAAIWRALEGRIESWEGRQGRLYPADKVKKLAKELIAGDTKIKGIGGIRAHDMLNCAVNVLEADIDARR